MSDSKDVSQLIENEELSQETQDELEAFKNLGEADNTRGIVRTDSVQGDIRAGSNSENLKVNTLENLKADGGFVTEVLTAEDNLDAAEDNDLPKLRDKSRSLNKADDSGEIQFKPDRGSLDLNKYLISNSCRRYIDEHVDVVATVENAPREISTPSVTHNNNTRAVENMTEPRTITDDEERNLEMRVQESYTRQTRTQIPDVPFRKSKIKLLQVFSVVAAVLFFPLGIPAVYFANKIEGEFNKGILLGNVDQANKLIKRTEKLIIFSFIVAFLIVVTVFTVLEYNIQKDDDKYLQSKTNHGYLIG